MKKLALVFVLLVTVFALFACSSPASSELTPVTVMLDWVPNTNHTGIYVAQAKVAGHAAHSWD